MSTTQPAFRQRYRLIGAEASPYSVKLRAILRYRHIPFDWVLRTPQIAEGLAHIKPLLMPVLQYPEDGSYHLDSTPIAYELEQRHPDYRSIIPDDPGLAFLSRLIEDMGDEWFTKPMFWYRFKTPIDQQYGASWVIGDARPDLEGDALAEAVEAFRQRQVGRMPLVGARPENSPIVEESYRRLLAILKDHTGSGRFLFGTRPALADFGLFGQLKTLATDPTPQAIMRSEARQVEHWVRRLDDASGIEGEWIDSNSPLPEVVADLLKLAGDIYLPFLLANAKAAESRQSEFTVTILGKPYTQAPFRYQVKCLNWLREELTALTGESAERVRTTLVENGCEELLS